MDRTLKDILWLHLAATLDMMDNAMSVCPDELWERPSPQMGFWYMAYHTLWFLDHDLSPAGEEFRPPAFDVYNYELGIKEPPYEHPYTKSDLRDYLQHCRGRCRTVIERLDQGDGPRIHGSQRIHANVTEVLVDQIRHVQHHAAQLNLLLRQTTDSAPDWVRRTQEALTPG